MSDLQLIMKIIEISEQRESLQAQCADLLAQLEETRTILQDEMEEEIRDREDTIAELQESQRRAAHEFSRIIQGHERTIANMSKQQIDDQEWIRTLAQKGERTETLLRDTNARIEAFQIDRETHVREMQALRDCIDRQDAMISALHGGDQDEIDRVSRRIHELEQTIVRLEEEHAEEMFQKDREIQRLASIVDAALDEGDGPGPVYTEVIMDEQIRGEICEVTEYEVDPHDLRHDVQWKRDLRDE